MAFSLVLSLGLLATITVAKHAEHIWQVHHTSALDYDEPVFGDLYPAGIYWVFIEVGNPPVRFPVALDTGSFTLDIPMTGCQGCPTSAPNGVYDVTKTSTGRGLAPDECIEVGGQRQGNECTFSNTYQTCDLSDPTAPCTISGNWYHDEVTVGDIGPVNVSFGAINYETKNFDQFKVIDGVMGLSGYPGQTNTFSQLFAAKDVKENLYAMCLVEGSKSNGTITFGEIDDRLYTGSITWTPNEGNYLWSLTLGSITIGDKSVPGNYDDNVILDSGTNILLLDDQTYQGFQSTLQSFCQSGSNLHGLCDVKKTIFDGECFSLTAAQIAAYPSITLQLDGIDLEIPGSHYLVQRYTPGSYCLGVLNEGPGAGIILGDTLMSSYYVIFDNTNNRVGWAPVNKENCGSIE